MTIQEVVGGRDRRTDGKNEEQKDRAAAATLGCELTMECDVHIVVPSGNPSGNWKPLENAPFIFCR